MSQLIALLIALDLVGSTADASPIADADPVTQARAEATAFPEDYGARATLARALCAASEWSACAEAWGEAGRIAGGNVEAGEGRLAALARSGDHQFVRKEARAFLSREPASALAWRLLGNSQAEFGPVAPGWSLPVAASSWRRAALLDPTDLDAWCRWAGARIDLGDRLGAVRLLGDRAVGCDDAVQRGLRVSHRLTAGVSGGVSGTVGARPKAWGPTTSFGGIVELGSLSWVGATARLTRLDGPYGSWFQGEVWGRLGLGHHGAGGEVVLGWVDPSDQQGAFVVAGRAWATLGATLSLELATADWAAGRTLQGAVALRVPILRALAVRGGFGFTQDLGSTTGSAADAAPMGEADLFLHLGKVELQAGGSWGEAQNLLSLDDLVAWNTADPVIAAGRARVTVRPVPVVGFVLSYDLLRLASRPEVTHLHTVTLGLSFTAPLTERP